MWIIVMFDLPVDTKTARRQYTLFRNELLRGGFARMQFSVYIRHCASEENAQVHLQRIEHWLPPLGEVRVLSITDKQFGRMQVFFGKKRRIPEPPPPQLELF